MSSFAPDVTGNAGDAATLNGKLRDLLRELEVTTSDGPDGAVWTEYTPGGYDPIGVRFRLPAGLGILAVEGELVELGDEVADDLWIALNYLNSEVSTYRFFVGEGRSGKAVFARQDLLPNLEDEPALHPRELRQAMTGLCAQGAIFAESLKQVQGGRSWRYVKDALRAFR